MFNLVKNLQRYRESCFDDFFLTERIYFFLHIHPLVVKACLPTTFSTVLYLDWQKNTTLNFSLGTLGSRVILATHAFPMPGHFRKISYWEAKVPLTILWQSSKALYEKKNKHLRIIS